MSSLKDKVVLVTGAQQGIGRAIAIACSQAGAKVVINYLDDEDAAEAVAQAVRDNGSQATIVQGDVSRAADVERMFTAAADLGGVDVLVNNAGIFPRVAFLELSETDWQTVLDVNLKGTFLCTQAAARRMVTHGRGGSVINLTSGAAFRSSPRGVHYVASKAGIVGLTRAAALELAPHQIRVNAIAPGLTDTAQPRYGMSEDEIREAGTLVPLGDISQPENIADLAVFLAADTASQITGQTIHVNGGQYLY